MDLSPDNYETPSLVTTLWSLADVNDLSDFLHQELPVKISLRSSSLCGCESFYNMCTFNGATICEAFVSRVAIP